MGRKQMIVLEGDKKKAYDLLISKCVEHQVFNAKVIMGIFDLSNAKVYNDRKAAHDRRYNGIISLKEAKIDHKPESLSKLWKETCSELNLDPKEFNDVYIDTDDKLVYVDEPVPVIAPTKTFAEALKEKCNHKLPDGKSAMIFEDPRDTSKKRCQICGYEEEVVAVAEPEESEDDFNGPLYKLVVSRERHGRVVKLDPTHNVDAEVQADLFQNKICYKSKYIIPYALGQSFGSREQIHQHIERFINDNAVVSINDNIRKDVSVYIRNDEYSQELLYLIEYCNQRNIHLNLYEVTGYDKKSFSANKISEPTAVKSVKTEYCERVEKIKNAYNYIEEILWASNEDPMTIDDSIPVFKISIVKPDTKFAHILICTDIDEILAYHSMILKAKYTTGLFDGYSIFLDEITRLRKRDKSLTRFIEFQ